MIYPVKAEKQNKQRRPHNIELNRRSKSKENRNKNTTI